MGGSESKESKWVNQKAKWVDLSSIKSKTGRKKKAVDGETEFCAGRKIKTANQMFYNSVQDKS